MSADPKKNPQSNEPSREQMMRVLIPAGAIALIVIVVAVLVASFEGTKPGNAKDDKDKAFPRYPPPTGGTNVSKMSDGTDPTAEDKDLKPLDPSYPGLLYRDLKVGDGDVVRSNANVTAYYTGWLTNGFVFDSSRKRSEATPFDMNRVVKGWMVGIPGMKIGGIRKLVIPPEYGYKNITYGEIPANSTLIFEIEIVAAN